MNETVAVPEVKGMVVNSAMKEYLVSSTKWAKFLLILQSIAAAFLVIMAIAVFAFGSTIGSKLYGVQGTAIGGILGFVYLLIAAIVIYPIVKGFGFVSGVRTACETDNEAELLRGFHNMRSWLKFYGILAIILLVLYALIFLFAIIAAVAM